MTQSAPSGIRGSLARMSPRARAGLILGLILAVLIVAFLLLSGGGDEVAQSPTPRTTVRTTPRATPSASATPIPETDEAFEGKDPFQPLVEQGTGGGGSPLSGGGGGTPEPTSTGNPTGGGTEAHRVSLEDVFTEDGTRFATVKVDGKEYTVSEGDTFADNFRVLDLTKNCGTFVFGDERFTLCLGQEVRK